MRKTNLTINKRIAICVNNSKYNQCINKDVCMSAGISLMVSYFNVYVYVTY